MLENSCPYIQTWRFLFSRGVTHCKLACVLIGNTKETALFRHQQRKDLAEMVMSPSHLDILLKKERNKETVRKSFCSFYFNLNCWCSRFGPSCRGQALDSGKLQVADLHFVFAPETFVNCKTTVKYFFLNIIYFRK